MSIPMSRLSNPLITRTSFKRWAGGRQRGRPFKDRGQLISAAHPEVRFASRGICGHPLRQVFPQCVSNPVGCLHMSGLVVRPDGRGP